MKTFPDIIHRFYKWFGYSVEIRHRYGYSDPEIIRIGTFQTDISGEE